MGDCTISAVDPRAFIWWRGVPICRRPSQVRPPRQGKHLRGGVWLTTAQLQVYRALRHQSIPVAEALAIARRQPPEP